MLTNVRHLTGAVVHGKDGGAGVVKEVLFDTRTWVIRHLAVGLEDEEFGRSHLVAPRFVHPMPDAPNEIAISLTDVQIAACPVARSTRVAETPPRPRSPQELDAEDPTRGLIVPGAPDAYVRNSRDLMGCEVLARDGAVGELADLFFDNENWRVEFLLVDTAGYPVGGRKILLAPQGVEQLDLLAGTVHFSMMREQVMRAPQYHEMVLHDTDA